MCIGVPAKIVAIDADSADRATVEAAGVRTVVSTALLADDPPQTGDWVLVHMGFAMTTIDESTAAEITGLVQATAPPANGTVDTTRNRV